MELKELIEFAEIEIKRLRDQYGSFEDKEKETYLCVLKLNEEFGEFCDAILNQHLLQRGSKLKKSNLKELGHEFADTLFCVLLLGHYLEIDMDKAVKEKIKIIESRHQKLKIIK